MPKHQVSELTGEKLEAARRSIFRRESSQPGRIHCHERPSAPPHLRFWVCRDPGNFQFVAVMHGATEEEATKRLEVFEAFGDVVELPE
jgi:hypothetical protein